MAVRAVPFSFSSAYLADPHFNPEPVEARFAVEWKNLKKRLFGSDHGISFAMLRIEKQCQYPSEDSAVKVEELFVRLKKAFLPELKKWKLGSVQGIFSASDFIELQSIRNQWADQDLDTIWIKPGEGLRDKLRAVQAFDNRPAPEKLSEVKVWMQINANSVYLKQIKELDLSHMGLRTLPLEIFRLKALKILKLEGNLFTTFPYNLSAFPELERYSLDENEVEVSPRDQIRRDPSRFDAEVMCDLKYKQVLGVRVAVPRNTSCAWQQIYEFRWTGTSWAGNIPRAAKFTFVCIDHLVKRIFDEKKGGEPVVRINWEGQRVAFPVGEVRF